MAESIRLGVIRVIDERLKNPYLLDVREADNREAVYILTDITATPMSLNHIHLSEIYIPAFVDEDHLDKILALVKRKNPRSHVTLERPPEPKDE